MNTSKIAALYDAVGYASLLALSVRTGSETPAPYNALDWRVRSLLFEQALSGPNGRTYGISLKNMDDETVRVDAQGSRQYEYLRLSFPLRVYQWVAAQLHEPQTYGGIYNALREAHPGHDVWSAHAMQYPAKNSPEKAEGVLCFGIEADFAVLVRGLRAYQRTQDKAVRKVLAQLAAYHRAEEVKQLRQGLWLGTEKALTTAARVHEPGIAFLGDMNLTPEQRNQLHYWAVPENSYMSAAFPVGTGLALKEVTSGKQLVDGAVYLHQVTWGQPGDAHYGHTLLLGRLDMAKKKHGTIPLCWDDEPERYLMCWAQWKTDATKRCEVKLMRVMYYTTQAPQLAPAIRQVVARPVLQAQTREVSYAVAA